MDEGQLVVEPHCLLIQGIGLEFLPCTDIVEQLSKLHGNLVRRNADVSLRLAKPSSPFPHLIEHAFV